MQYFVSVIAEGTELATPGEMDAIDAFNDKLQRLPRSVRFPESSISASCSNAQRPARLSPVSRFVHRRRHSITPTSPRSTALRILAESAALVMELVDGEDLSRRIARGAIPLAEALPMAKQIAEALEAAHDRGSFTAT